MSPRPPIDAPELEGYSIVELIGTGGFADVFLYQQDFPKQRVAIKFMVGDAVGDEQRERFTAEANAMASVSNHPYIVSVYRADVSPQGYPYLVMEYYPKANYSYRAKHERFLVADVLRVGVQIASAVETAHRAGVLHRDIKPANILTSEYGRPALTDFGIAAVKGSAADEAEGMSVPWSPPEVVVGDGLSDERADVYSLAATLYTLLAGRSPFEVPGGENRTFDLIGRIQKSPVPAIERPDVPGSLQRLLAQSMSKDPAARPASAAAFARELQAIEVEQRFSVTDFEVSDVEPENPSGLPIDADAGSTKVKNPVVIEAQSPVGQTTTTQARSNQTFSRTYIRPASQRPVGAAPGDLIHQTPYIPPAQAPIPTAPVTPRRATVAQPTTPAAGTYRAAQPTPVPIQRRNRVPAWAAVAIAIALIAAIIGIAGVVVRSGASGGDDFVADICQIQRSDPSGKVIDVRWNPGADARPGDQIRVSSQISGQSVEKPLDGALRTTTLPFSDQTQPIPSWQVVRAGQALTEATQDIKQCTT
ncbi:MAG: protein kinase domain-containing protein [Microthrixaceae bacterium]